MNTKSRLFLFLSVIAVCFFSQNAFAQLSGTYTIDPKGSGASNYKNFSDAAADLNTNGVSGPVVIKVANGTYKEQFELDSIVGADSTNTITFESASGDSSKAILSFRYSNSQTYLVYLNSASWITFKQLTLENKTDTCVNLVLLENRSSNDQFLNNRFLNKIYTTTYVIKSEYTNQFGENLVIKNNVIKCGGDGLYLYINSAIITGNIIDSFYYYAVNSAYTAKLVISNNIITSDLANYGLSLDYAGGTLLINNNYIYLGNGGCALQLIKCHGTSSLNQWIYNNIAIINGSNTGHVFEGYTCAFQKWEFNNILNLSNSYSAALFFSGIHNCYIQNNNIINSSSYYAAYAMDVDSLDLKTMKFDYNNYYSKSQFVNYNGKYYDSLSIYQSSTAQDKHSISIDPKYVSTTNLHIRDSSLIYAGTPVSGITTDIDGDLRNAVAPTIGADEIPSSGCTSAFNTASSVCLGDTSYFTDASTFIYQDSIANWSWNFGDTSAGSTLRNPKHVYRYAGTDTVQFYVTTKSGLTCKSSHVITVSSVCYMALSGNVKTSLDSALKNSKIYLCTFNSADTTVNVIDSVLTDSFGAYSFSMSSDSVYLLAMPALATFPHEMPTWSDSGLVFPDANAVVLHHGTNTKNFKTIYGSNPGGSGFIGGRILSCPLCKANAPVIHLRVILADSNGKAQEYTYTDANGVFEFKNITSTKYKILVDRPHINNSKAPVVDISNYSSGKLAFTLYPTYLYLDIATGIEKQLNDATISIYPNPANSILYLQLTKDAVPPFKGVRGMTSACAITDLSGKTILTQQIHSEETAIDISSLPAGIYLIRYQDIDRVWNGKFVKE